MKVAVVGDQAAGKTGIIKAFSGLPFSSHYEETHEVRIWDTLLSDPKQDLSTLSELSTSPTVRAQFWDCGANALDRSKMHRMLDGALVAMVVYDVTNYDSYQNAASKWLQQVRLASPDIFTVLVGCKSDQFSCRAVELEEVEDFARRNDLFFMEVSAKNAENIQLTLSILRIRAKHTLNREAFMQQNEIVTTPSSRARSSPISTTKTPVESISFTDLGISSQEELTIRSIIGRKKKDESSIPETTTSEVAEIQNVLDDVHDLNTNARLAMKQQPTRKTPVSPVPNVYESVTKNEYDQLTKLISSALDEPENIKSLENHHHSRKERKQSIDSNDASSMKSLELRWQRKPPSSISSSRKSIVRPEQVTLYDKHTESFRNSRKDLKSVSSSSAPDLFVDISIQGKNLGSIAVREGDHPAFLASEFVRANHLDPMNTQKLAKILQQRVSEFYDDQISQKKLDKVKHERAKPKSPSFAQRRNSLDRPILGTLHVKVAKGRVSKLVVRKGDNPKELVTSFRKTFGLRHAQAAELEHRIVSQLQYEESSVDTESNTSSYQPIRVDTSSYQPIRVDTSSYQPIRVDTSSYQPIRVDTSSYQPIRVDTSSYQPIRVDTSHETPHTLPSPIKYPSMLTQKQRQLLEATLEGSSVNIKSPTRPPPAAPELLLFNLDVNIGQGKSGRISVHQHDNMHDLAKTFCLANELNMSKVSRVEFLLSEKLKMHVQ